MQGSLQCQAAKQGSRELLLKSGLRKGASVGDSQEFFRQNYNSENLCLRPTGQNDADDEEESEQVCCIFNINITCRCLLCCVQHIIFEYNI